MQYYQLIDPEGIYRELKREADCLTIKECADRIGVDPGSLGRAIEGHRVWPKTVRAIAEAVHRRPLDIARES